MCRCVCVCVCVCVAHIWSMSKNLIWSSHLNNLLCIHEFSWSEAALPGSSSFSISCAQAVIRQRAHQHARTHAHTHTRTPHTHTHTHTHAHTHAHTHTHTRVQRLTHNHTLAHKHTVQYSNHGIGLDSQLFRLPQNPTAPLCVKIAEDTLICFSFVLLSFSHFFQSSQYHVHFFKTLYTVCFPEGIRAFVQKPPKYFRLLCRIQWTNKNKQLEALKNICLYLVYRQRNVYIVHYTLQYIF